MYYQLEEVDPFPFPGISYSVIMSSSSQNLWLLISGNGTKRVSTSSDFTFVHFAH